MTTNTLGIVMHDLLPVFIPKMSLIRTLPFTHPAVNTEFLIALNYKIIVVLINWLVNEGTSPRDYFRNSVIRDSLF